MKERIMKKKWQILAILVCAVIGILFCRKTYYAFIIALFGIYSMVATGLDVLFGYTGQISLGHAGLFAIGAYVTTLLTMRLGLPNALSLVAGTVVTTIAGTLIAIPASRLVKHFLSLLMIAFGQIVYLIVNSWMAMTGGSMGIKGIPSLNLFGYKFDSNFKCAVIIWLFLGIIIFLKNRIINSRVGYAFIAIRENPVAARGLGIDVRLYKVLAFAVSAAMTGLAGGLYAFLRGFISPETFNGTQSTLFMTMLLFGGITTSSGPVIGTVILLLIKELFQSFASWQGLIYAGFMLAVLFFFPNGVVGVYQNIRQRIKRINGKKMTGEGVPNA